MESDYRDFRFLSAQSGGSNHYSGAGVDAGLDVCRSVEKGVKEAFRRAASRAPLQGVLKVLEQEWTSSRIVGDPHSSIVDLPLVEVSDGELVSVAAWYDNEMGYATRLAEVALALST
jgi:glyceraldehyde-3-phosphate dehydrogenase/erythrose-4-phosphate dehydrogenase